MTQRPTVLVVEDDEILAASLTTRLELEGLTPVRATTCRAALAALERRDFDAVVSDIRLPDGSGADVFFAERARFAMTPTVFATAYGDVDEAVRLVKAGATDYLTKPYDLGALVDLLHRVTRSGPRTADPDRVASVAPAMVRLEAAIERLADAPQNVLFVGPAGSGRQTLARRLHEASRRRDEPFVVVEGAALNTPAGERLLFGQRDGTVDEPGLVDEVGAGTLLVTEVADLAPETQARLLRFVEDHRYRPIGATAERLFTGRIVATSDVDPAEAAAPGGLRPDLLHRFGVVELRVPPLAEREADIVPIAEHVLATTVTPDRTDRPRFSPEAIGALEAHDWPGNLRELRNRVVRAALLASGDEITAADLFPEHPGAATSADHTLDAARRDAERQVIEAALTENQGRIVETARALGISRVTLWSKMKRLGIARS